MRKLPIIADEPIVIFGAEERDFRVAASSKLIAALCTYAQARLSSGTGMDRLAAAGFAISILRDLYALGFIPPTYRDALHPDDAAAIIHIDLTNALTLPAFDATGGLIDLCCWRLDNTTTPTWIGSLAAQPAGILAPRLAQVSGEVTVVDSLDLLGSRMACGGKQILLLRADIDLTPQLRTFAAGVPDRIVGNVANDQVRIVCCDVGLRIAVGQDVVLGQLVSVTHNHNYAVFSNISVSGDIGDLNRHVFSIIHSHFGIYLQ